MIAVNEPLLDGNEKKYLIECIDSGWISSEGPFVKKFEEEFSKLVERKYGIAVSSGTAAIDIAVTSLGIGKDDEVIIPTFTIISCINQIIRAGAKPVFIDCDPLTWNMDTSQIEKKITNKTKAIMVVHIFGLPVDIDPILEIAQKYNIRIIEDAAQMHGQKYKGKPCGSFGDISCFSFYPNKHITTGEGGMIVTDNEYLSERCKSLRNLCLKPEKRFFHEELGWNYRMTNIQAALGLAQLERLEEFVSRKREIGKLYTRFLSDLDNYIQIPIEYTEYAKNIYWVYGIVLKKSVKFNAEIAMKKLSKTGIGTRPFFYPLHLQPVFKKMGLFGGESYPIAENIAERGFYLPSGLALTDSQIKEVAENLKKILG